jgi:Fe2+ or Zn2+ uptake regulation protein
MSGVDTVEGVVEASAVSVRTVRRNLCRLQRDGLIERHDGEDRYRTVAQFEGRLAQIASDAGQVGCKQRAELNLARDRAQRREQLAQNQETYQLKREAELRHLRMECRKNAKPYDEAAW